jgi:hypothetical protein
MKESLFVVVALLIGLDATAQPKKNATAASKCKSHQADGGLRKSFPKAMIE